MNRLVGLITGNPTLLLWLALGSFALGLTSGACGADAVGLNAARSWATGIRPGTSRDNPASARP